MASKKFSVLFVVMALLVSGAFAQTPTGYDIKDSSLIPAKRQPQHNEFLNNAYPFPAKPRNQWEIGIKGGVPTISGDVPVLFPTFGFGAHVRKAFGYVFSMRLEYFHGTMKGLSWLPSANYGSNDPWIARGYVPNRVDASGNRIAAVDRIFNNYKASVNDLSLQGVVTLNNVRFHKSKSGFNFYGFAGIGATIYDTKVNAMNGGTRYNFNSINQATDYSDRKDTRSDLKNLLDDSYETDAESEGNRRPELFGSTLKPSGHLGFGLAIKLSKRINLALEERFTVVKTDLLDGVRWSEQPHGDPVLTPDYDSYNFVSLGLNVNLGAKATEPLWWVNPLDYAYNEINAPRHMKLPKPVLDDADGDGITDQFDQEPNTPSGAPVDSHGVSKDTDGDGVPDIKDKELITPTQCQPVDADGVGKCPPPACCDSISAMMQNMTMKQGCGIGDLPSISFAGRTVTLSNDAKAVLTSVADKLRNNPNCRVAVIGYGESSKAAQQLSWDRVNAVIKHMVEKEGISEDRFIFKYGQGEGDGNTVDLRDGSGEEGPNTVPAPHPNLRKKK